MGPHRFVNLNVFVENVVVEIVQHHLLCDVVPMILVNTLYAFDGCEEIVLYHEFFSHHHGVDLL